MCLHLFAFRSSALCCSCAVFGPGDVLHASLMFLALNPCLCWEWQLSRVHMSEPVRWSRRLWLVLLLTDIIKHYITPSKIQVLFEVTAVERAVFAHRVITGLIFWSYSHTGTLFFLAHTVFIKQLVTQWRQHHVFHTAQVWCFLPRLFRPQWHWKGFFFWFCFTNGVCHSRTPSPTRDSQSGPVTTVRAIKEWVFHL